MNKTFIAFANQKGGAGKTILATLFADYITERRPDISLVVADFDHQTSLSDIREQDKTIYPDEVFSYDVETYPIRLDGVHTIGENYDYIRQTLLALRGKADVVIIDTPGSLMEDNIIFILKFMSVVVTPFAYDRTSWFSLMDYLDELRVLKEPPIYAKFETFFILNKFDPRVGTIAEKETWKKMNDYLAQDGMLAPPVPAVNELTRYTTLKMNKKQMKAVQPCFDFLYDNIFGKDEHEQQDGKERTGEETPGTDDEAATTEG